MSVFFEGEVKSIRRFDGGYTVVTLMTEDGQSKRRLSGKALIGAVSQVTITGHVLSNLHEGMRVKVHAEEFEHPKYGRQYKAFEVESCVFTNLDGIANYLASDAFHNVGVVTGMAIAKHFGMKTLDILDDDPELIRGVPGVSESRAEAIIKTWREARGKHRALAELMGYGVSAIMAHKIFDLWGEDAVENIKANPYSLVDISGIGFLRADSIALTLGHPRVCTHRAQAAGRYALEIAKSGGHCYLWMDTLVSEVVKLLNGDMSHDLCKTAVAGMASDDFSAVKVIEGRKVYLTQIYNAESNAAYKLKQMNSYKRLPVFSDIEELREYINTNEIMDSGMVLAQEQERAVFQAMNSSLLVLTGGPGTGKTQTVRTICKLFEGHGISYRLVSPTGRAAKRLTEATSKPASTIHRLLESDRSGGFKRNEHNPIYTDCVLVDESSMLDIELFNSLLRALPVTTRLILVGDKNQLPSVGPGNVLRDIIESNVVPTVHLNHIFRQAHGSSIVSVAHDILNGVVPDLPVPKQSKGSNCVFIPANEQEDVVNIMLALIHKQLPKVGFEPSDIQVLTPMRRRGLGVEDLNPAIQTVVNPDSPNKKQHLINGTIWRVGDKVMHIKNNYDKGDEGIFNGEIGTLNDIQITNGETNLYVAYPDQIGGLVSYEPGIHDQLYHANALTIHKSQGAEYPVAIVVIHPSQSIMLQRNLLYTAITRAKKLCIIIGTREALQQAVENDKIQSRNTTLKRYLTEGEKVA